MMSVSEKVNQAARKLRVYDLTKIRNIDDCWWYIDGNIKFHVGFVWLQGDIIRKSYDDRQVELLDDEMPIRITECQSIPGHASVQLGVYVMVIGEINFIEGEMCIAANKIAVIPNADIHKSSWPFEVCESKKVIMTIEANNIQ